MGCSVGEPAQVGAGAVVWVVDRGSSKRDGLKAGATGPLVEVVVPLIVEDFVKVRGRHDVEGSGAQRPEKARQVCQWGYIVG